MNDTQSTSSDTKTVGIAGSGTIACGLAAAASESHNVVLWARSDSSAERAGRSVNEQAERLEGARADRISVTTDRHRLAHAQIVVEAIAEEIEPKRALYEQLDVLLSVETILATTTSSLGVTELAAASRRPDRFFALHVFNPVPRMKLVELSFPPAASAEVRAGAFALCEAMGKTAVEVPDLAGFVVNRLLFPFLFDAVRYLEDTDLAPKDIDSCMKLGAGHPIGPLALLDYVGLDVADAIGEALFADSGKHHHKPPARIKVLVREGKLGRKSGCGFYDYAG